MLRQTHCTVLVLEETLRLTAWHQSHLLCIFVNVNIFASCYYVKYVVLVTIKSAQITIQVTKLQLQGLKKMKPATKCKKTLHFL